MIKKITKKYKGFTLVELLAVIVILAIIALIATPIILNIIENARKDAAKASALGYIRAVENELLIEEMTGENIKNGFYYTEDLKVDYNGKGPEENSYVIIKNRKVEEYGLIYYGYLINNKNNEVVVEKTKEKKVTLLNGITEEETIKDVNNNKTIMELKDIEEGTNIYCNNDAIPSVNEKTLTLENITSDTKCKISKKLSDTINEIDDSKNNIVMIKNEEELDTIYEIGGAKQININLNGKNISNYRITNYGNLIIDDKSTSKGTINNINNIGNYNNIEIYKANIISTNTGDASAICNNGNIKVYEGAYIEGPYGIGCFSKDDSKIYMYGGEVKATNYNGISFNPGYKSYGYIYGGKITSEKGYGLGFGGSEEFYIESTNNPIYISSLSKEYRSAILINSNSKIYIKSKYKEADICSSDANKTTKGICIYAEGDKNYINNTANEGIHISSNFSPDITIDGATIYGGYMSLNNSGNSKIMIKNAKIKSENIGLGNYGSGSVYICEGSLEGEEYQIEQSSTGYVYYSDKVKLNNFNGTNIELNNSEACQIR